MVVGVLSDVKCVGRRNFGLSGLLVVVVEEKGWQMVTSGNDRTS